MKFVPWNDLISKTIQNVDTSAANLTKITFTDGTILNVECEYTHSGIYAPVLTKTEENKNYKIPVTWMETCTMNVLATSLDDAKQKVLNGEGSYCYYPNTQKDTFRIDENELKNWENNNE